MNLTNNFEISNELPKFNIPEFKFPEEPKLSIPEFKLPELPIEIQADNDDGEHSHINQEGTYQELMEMQKAEKVDYINFDEEDDEKEESEEFSTINKEWRNQIDILLANKEEPIWTPKKQKRNAHFTPLSSVPRKWISSKT